MSVSSTQIHVVYIITKLELGGAQKVCLSLLHGVADDFFSTSLIAGAGGVLDASVRDNATVTLLPELKREVALASLYGELCAFYSLVKQLRALRQQHPRIVIHTHSSKAGILGRWAAFFARIPMRVHTVHGYAFHAHQGWISWLLIYAAELVTSLVTTHFVCVSSADVVVGKRLFPGFRRAHTIIRAAIAWDSFAVQAAQRVEPQLVKGTRPFIFGTVSCFKPQKNLIDFLRAFHAVYQRNADVRCEIVGDGVLRPQLESFIAQHGLTDVVTLHGWQHEVAPIMARWNVFVLTSLWEGLPCAAIEARVLKLPVFSYVTGGIADVIIPHRNGMLYPQGHWQALADGLYRASRDEAWYRLLSEYQDQLGDFHDQAMVDQHRRLYARLAGIPFSCNESTLGV